MSGVLDSEALIHVCPKCDFEFDRISGPEKQTEKDRNLQLWNPMAVAWWSFVLSPLFGAFLLDQNWCNLGQKESAKITRLLTWASGSFVILVVTLGYYNPYLTLIQAIKGPFQVIPFILIGTCFNVAKKQKKFIDNAEMHKFQNHRLVKPIRAGLLSMAGQTHVQIIKSKDVIDLFLEFQYDTKKRI
jgi:hypothetical protein